MQPCLSKNRKYTFYTIKNSLKLAHYQISMNRVQTCRLLHKWTPATLQIWYLQRVSCTEKNNFILLEHIVLFHIPYTKNDSLFLFYLYTLYIQFWYTCNVFGPHAAIDVVWSKCKTPVVVLFYPLFQWASTIKMNRVDLM